MAFGDVVVLLPGISGSALVKDGREVWGTSTGAILRTLATGADSIRSLTLTAPDDPTLDDLGDGVTATALIQDLHLIPGLWKIDGYSRTRAELVNRLGLVPGENYFELPYDWRRDNRVAARLLERRATGWLRRWRERSGNADAKLALVAHSMGGLVARHFLEVLGGWRETRTLVSFGTPYAGSLRALGYLSEGYGAHIGPVSIDFSGVLRSFTSVYQLLPTYRCLVMPDGSLGRVAETPGLLNVDQNRAADAATFHRGIAEARTANTAAAGYGYGIFPVVGIEQPTFQSARLEGGRPILQMSHPKGDFGGDGTVPRVSAIPDEVRHAGREMYAADAHGSLQNAAAVLEQLYGVLTAGGVDFETMRSRQAPVTLGLAIEDAYPEDLPFAFRVQPSVPVPGLRARVMAVGRSGEQVLTLRPTGDGAHAGILALPAGAYRIRIEGAFGVSPVTDTFVVVPTGFRPAADAAVPSRPPEIDAHFEPSYEAEAKPLDPDENLRSAFSRFVRRNRTASLERFEIREMRNVPGMFRIDPPEAPAPAAAPAPAYPPAPSYAPAPPMAAPSPAPAYPSSPAAPAAPMAAPAYPAPDPDRTAGADEGTAILRHPAIDLLGPVLAGREVAITVDLQTAKAAPATEGGPVRLAGLPESWTSLAVGVELFSTGIDFDPGAKDIEVLRNGASRRVVFLGRVHGDLAPGQSTEVVALFRHEGRFAGMARRSVLAGDQAVAPPERLAAATPPSAPVAAAGGIVIEPRAPAPDLTVRIFHPENTPEGFYYWSLDVRDPFDTLPARLSGAINLGKDAEAFAAEIMHDCPTLQRGAHIDTLNGLGEQIWSKVPECFRAAYWAMRAARRDGFAIQFITDDPHVPWELMRPIDATGERAEPILALAHPVARWIADREGQLRNRLPAGSIVSIAPRYRNPNDFLEWAQGEAAVLRANGAIPIGGTVGEVMALLKAGVPGRNVALVHFAGHGSFGAGNASQILLEDGVLRPVQIGTNEVRLGVMQQPFVMLNACEIGSLTSVLGSVGGWAEVFSRRRFSGVLAPLWAVYDDDASQIARDLVAAVWHEGERIGEALRRIRASRQDSSATPFAYMLYGDVMAGVEDRVNA